MDMEYIEITPVSTVEIIDAEATYPSALVPDEDKDQVLFTKDRSLMLINLYKKYIKRIGYQEVRTVKKMWEVISQELSEHFNVYIAPNKCENRFKVLQRNYKKAMVSLQNGSKWRRCFEFQNEMSEIFEDKKLVLPSNSSQKLHTEHSYADNATIDNPKSSRQPYTRPYVYQPVQSRDSPSASRTVTESEEEAFVPISKRSRLYSSFADERRAVLTEVKLKYYEQQNRREEEKLELAKRKQIDREKRTELLRECVEILRNKFS